MLVNDSATDCHFFRTCPGRREPAILVLAQVAIALAPTPGIDRWVSLR